MHQPCSMRVPHCQPTSMLHLRLPAPYSCAALHAALWCRAAPEILWGERCTEKADIYSFGECDDRMQPSGRKNATVLNSSC